MSKLSEFGFKDVVPGAIDVSDLPAQPGAGFEPLRQPGDYIYSLPTSPDLVAAAFEKDLDEKGVAWPVLKFAGDSRLFYADGTRFQTRMSSAPRNGKPGALQYLAKALSYDGPATPGLLAKALVGAAGKSFKAELQWAVYCNPNADIYGPDGKIAGKKGCGARFAEKPYKRSDGVQVGQIPQNPDGTLAERFECSCGAQLRVFGNLRNFRKVG
jgi:hypothetical protein